MILDLLGHRPPQPETPDLVAILLAALAAYLIICAITFP
jgi:hypothetical protein